MREVTHPLAHHRRTSLPSPRSQPGASPFMQPASPHHNADAHCPSVKGAAAGKSDAVANKAALFESPSSLARGKTSQPDRKRETAPVTKNSPRIRVSLDWHASVYATGGTGRTRLNTFAGASRFLKCTGVDRWAGGTDNGVAGFSFAYPGGATCGR